MANETKDVAPVVVSTASVNAVLDADQAKVLIDAIAAVIPGLPVDTKNIVLRVDPRTGKFAFAASK